MTIDDAARRLLEGGGGAYLDFKTLGQVRKGRILAATVQQETDFRTKVPLKWPNGDPRMQVVITLDTGERTEANPDGIGRIYTSYNMIRAISDAATAVGVKGIDVGGDLALQYYADGQASDQGNAPKLYRAQYQPPAAGMAAANDLLGASASAPAPAPIERPAQALAAQPSFTDFPAPAAPAPVVNPWAS